MKALIIGLGLIGGSLAKAFKKYQIASEIAVFDPNIASCKQAMADGVANEICHDLSNKEELSQYQIIVIACPLGAFVNIAPLVFNNASETALIFDVCSLKNFAELDFKSIHPNFNPSTFANLPQNFIPAHPIAGSHLTGYQNSDADLFVGKYFAVCLNKNPTELQQKFAEQLRQIIIKIGSKPIKLPPQDHDYIYGLVSHLPQYLSFLSYTISDINFFQINKLSCPYLQRCFRLNYSDKYLWHEIFMLNTGLLEFFFQPWKWHFMNILTVLFNAKNPYKTIREFIIKTQDTDISPTTLTDIKKNSTEIILRLISALAYLKIPYLNKIDRAFTGKGFADFTSIVGVLSIIDEQTFNQLFNDISSELQILFDNFNRFQFQPRTSDNFL